MYKQERADNDKSCQLMERTLIRAKDRVLERLKKKSPELKQPIERLQESSSGSDAGMFH